ncbi:MAG: acyl-CoA thioesterase [Bacteroidota bacterium]
MVQYDYVFRVKYSDTDKMGIVHHSNYARYFENARAELFRSVGVSYAEIEKNGYMFPVISLHIDYLKTIVYDEKVTIHTVLESIRGARLIFSFVLYNQNKEIVSKAQIQIACVYQEKWKPCSLPEFIVSALQNARDSEKG